MKWFNDFKIAKKLIFTFTLISLFIGIVGFIGLYNMSRINSNSVSMYKIDLMGVKTIGELKQNILQIHTDVLSLVYDKDVDEIQILENEINQLKDKNDKLLSDYQSTITTEQDKEMYSQFTKLLQDYRTAREEIVKSVKANKYDEALADFHKADVIRIKMTEVLNKYVDFNMGLAQKDYEKNNSIYRTSFITVITVIIFGLFTAIVLGLIIASIISKQLKQVVIFAEALGSGDLTQTIHIDSKDEIGDLAKSLNNASNNVRGLISDIIVSASDISATSEELSATTEEISSNMESVNESTEQIVQGSQDLGAATEEISASTEEISSTTDDLANKSTNSAVSVRDIRKRAIDIKARAEKEIAIGNKTYSEKHDNIIRAIEEGKIVEEIKVMADTIANISEHTNLLALNAAIEAARAGEQGKGFAVVADEVRKLAEQSSYAVTQIQDMVKQVKSAFDNLSNSGTQILDYITNNVKPSYELLLNTGIQYENDSEFISNMSEDIAAAATQISETIKQVSSSIESMSAVSEESVSSSEEISNSINEITMAVDEVSKSAQAQAELAQKLNNMVQKFKV
ncbi:methyl-accepting chemotaxis protein [Clostridium sp. OS1-26]|uniref:methyl-accepting chemotaxis protein n=1 Tax=Clostridium sp. OS1-26 TaxID=3070681 RepID=UPI0027DF6563|nr:methyl-accepting chemotaxis protein [Clostridium sp. OS1-26]WML33236.1 methyl-accepting chemotaxis protein [Clostridium sp. OS1-26]